MNRRFATASILLPLAAAASLPAFAAEAYPTRPIKLIIPFSVGGGTDTVSRVFADHLKNRLGQAVIVENKGGAGSAVGTEHVVRSEPDGYTLLVNADTVGIFPLIYPNLKFDVRTDLTPISFFASAPIVLVAHPSASVKDVAELIALARKQPGAVTLATSGLGTPHDLAAILFSRAAKVELNEIAYKGNGPALADVVAGHVQIGMFTLSSVQSYAAAGKLKLLAVTSSKRTPLAPEVPSMAEAGLPSVDMSSRYLLLAPAKTPKAVVGRFEKEVAEMARTPAFRDQLSKMGFETLSTTSKDTEALLQKERERWAPIFDSAKLAPKPIN
ncbi:Bug family tripartite tricarboxylate transporter substrate binding protein [Variovorax boronicumulans]|uniref:Bug family tripartite tricarboxylate transporter substrate binding protein n=1 Tax=Variovorax boronicumulans TaxID=436515 RepID=UPI0033974601